jgi:hypothetical protein
MSSSQKFFLIICVFAASPLYFLPWIVAYYRGHQNTAAIALLNLFLGWSFLGWVIALVWSATVVRTSGGESLAFNRSDILGPILRKIADTILYVYMVFWILSIFVICAVVWESLKNG